MDGLAWRAHLPQIYQGHSDAPSEELLDDFWALFCHGEGQAVAHRVGAFWQERKALRARLLGALLTSGARLRLINGSADPNSGVHMVRAYLQHPARADVVRLPRVGHWPQLQAPRDVLDASLMFLKAHGECGLFNIFSIARTIDAGDQARAPRFLPILNR